MKTIVIFDPKNLISANKSTFIRHQYYSQKLAELDSMASLTILTFRKNGKSFEYNHDNDKLKIHYLGLKIYSKRNREFLSKINTLVFGDPFLPPTLFRLLFLLYFCPKNIRIQIQLHGDFFQPKWKDTLRNKAKYFLIKINIRKANNLRFVSQQQLAGFKKTFPYFKNYFISPIAVTQSSSNIGDYGFNRPKVVGFLGRIDRERGIQTLVSVLKLFGRNSSIRFLIAGDGDLSIHLKNQIEKFDLMNEVEIVGFIEQKDLEDRFWSQIGILISTAPFESYGLTMREALIRNIPILTLKNSGSMELLNDFPDACIEFYEASKIDGLVTKIPEMLNLKIDAQLLPRQKSIDGANLEKLLRSWLGSQ